MIGENLGQTVVAGLAILGGAALGGLGFGVLTQLLTRVMIHRAVPPKPLLLCRLFGAVSAGWLVGLLVFGSGGFGLGGPGGGRFGAGAGTGKGDSSTTTSGLIPEVAKRPPGKSADETSLRVEVLGEGVDGGRFYRLESESTPRTLVEVQERLLERRRSANGARRLVLVVYENSPAADHPVVRDLERWAREQDFAVAVEKPLRAAP